MLALECMLTGRLGEMRQAISFLTNNGIAFTAELF